LSKALFDNIKAHLDAWYYERLFKEQGLWPVVGVDEVGRGCLAGPVVAAAVALPEDISYLGITDSKKLTPQKRQELDKVIKEKAIAFSIAAVPPETIDRINILNASLLAMKQAIKGLPIIPKAILIDGNQALDIEIVQRTLIKGDSRSCSIAAASIIAKVYRDSLMNEFSKKYPQYGFESHKGYATKVHKERLKAFGPCPIHRISFKGVA